MATRADSIGIRPVASTEATQRVASIADAKQQALAQFSSASIGKLFKAEVLSSLTDGSFTVKLQDSTTVQMSLPAGTQAGDKLELTLIGTQPRPTFSMPASPNQANTTSADLSQTGKLIDNLLRTAENQGSSPTLVGKTTIVASPDASPAQVASALKDTVAYSGLFYESHVTQWATGARPLTELLREPQAQFSDPKLLAVAKQVAEETSAPEATTPDPNVPSQQGAKEGAKLAQTVTGLLSEFHTPEAETAARVLAHAIPEAHLAEAEKTPGTQQATPKSDTAPTSSASQPNDTQTAESSKSLPASNNQATLSTTTASNEIAKAQAFTAQAATSNATDTTQPLPLSDPSPIRAESAQSETMRMVSLQLNTLENQKLMWRGEVWPGQQMDWEISEDASGGQGASRDSNRTWQSTLRVELPSLGVVAATISLHGQHVQVQVRAASEETASLLRTHGNKLASALETAGSPLDQLSVRQDSAT